MNQGLNALAVLLGVPPQPMDDLLRGPTGIPVPPTYVAVGIPPILSGGGRMFVRPSWRQWRERQIGIAGSQSLSGFQPDRDLWDGCQQHRPEPVEARLRRPRHHLRLRAGIPVEHSELRPDHQYRPGRRCAAANASGGLSKHRSEGAAGRRERPFELSAGPRAGRLSAPERGRGQRRAPNCISAIQSRHQGFHDRADGGAEPVYRTERPRDGGGRRVERARGALSGARGRVADPGGEKFVPATTAEEMRKRTDWGELLPPPGTPQPAAPALPTPEDVNANPRPPEW